MVVQTERDEEIDLIFQALADATRRDIMSRVLVGEQSVSALASGYAMSFAAVQKHVAVLERASLVKKERRGREQLVHGNREGLTRAQALLDHLESLWRHRIGAIDNILAKDSPSAHGTEKEDTDASHQYQNGSN
ncbi:MAG: metalloregulator ArsR/SmtB family transcription factor [Terrimesophilobacter sp.]